MNGLEYVSETNRFKKEQEYFRCIAEPIHSFIHSFIHGTQGKKKLTAKHN